MRVVAAGTQGRIVRMWRGYGTAEGIARYCDEHFTPTLLPQLRALDGFLGARVLVGTTDAETEVIVLTTWASFDAIHAFAGDDVSIAVVEPIVHQLLISFDDRVEHYRLAIDS